MNANKELAAELKQQISKFNKGIKNVEISDAGLISVFTANKKSVTGVTCDLLRSKAFASVKARVADCGTLYVVEALPNQVSA
jgi:hypothetical protein